MSLLTDLNKRIEKKYDELDEINEQIRRRMAEAQALEAVIAELQSVLKAAAKEDAGQQETETKLRRGSDVYQGREALRKLGKVSEIGEILKAMGKADTKDTRRSMSSQMSWYAKRNQIFTKPESNMFGLREWAKERADFLSGEYSIRVKLPVEQKTGVALPLPEEQESEPEEKTH